MNCTRRFIRVASSQGIELLPPEALSSLPRDCHPSTRSILLPMCPVCTPSLPNPSLPALHSGREGLKGIRNRKVLASPWKVFSLFSPVGRVEGREKRVGVMRGSPSRPAHPPHRVPHVVRHQQGAAPVHCDAHGPAHGVPLIVHEAGQHVERLAGGGAA